MLMLNLLIITFERWYLLCYILSDYRELFLMLTVV